MNNDLDLSPTAQYFKTMYEVGSENIRGLKDKSESMLTIKNGGHVLANSKASRLFNEEKALELSIYKTEMPSAEKVKELIIGINGMLEKEKSEIRFVFDATMKGRSMVSVYNVATGDLVHRMPPEVTVTISRNLNNQFKNGNIVDEAA